MSREPDDVLVERTDLMTRLRTLLVDLDDGTVGVMTPENAADFADVHLGLDVFLAGGPPIVARPQLVLSLRPRAALLERKVRALEAHHSQTGAVIGALGRRRFAAWVAAEDFVAARGPGAARPKSERRAAASRDS